MTLGWRWSLVYKIYRSKVEFPFPVSLTLSYSQHQSHISFGIDQITLSEAQCQQFGFALVGPLPPAAAKPPQKFSFKKLFAAKIKASEISQGDETAPVSTSASWGSDCSLKPRICNAHAAKEDLLRIRASSSVQSATWMVGVHLCCFSEEHITAAHITTKMGLCRDVWHWCRRARAHYFLLTCQSSSPAASRPRYESLNSAKIWG